MSRWARWLPLALFAGFAALVAAALLRPASTEVKSAMIGRALPAFALPAATAARSGLTRTDFVGPGVGGKPRLLNIFASWCIPCAAEAPQLAALATRGVEIDGIAIRDRREDLDAFLAAHGNPYARIGADDANAVQIAIGSSGVPESFVIDARGVIRYQHIGDIRADDVPLILARLREAAT